MKKKSPDILWVFAAIFVAGLLFSAVSEGVSGSEPEEHAVIGYVAGR
jgi:hypothetical protein